MHPRAGTAILLSFLTLQAAQDLELEVASLRKQDLPRGFPFYMLDKGFAVLRVKVVGRSSETEVLSLESLAVLDRKGKRLERARPEEITPRIMKLYLATRRGIHGQARRGREPTPRQWERVPTVDPNPSPRPVSAGRAGELRALLEGFELQPGTLEPGGSAEGFIYLKSKKWGRDLSGGRLSLGGASAPIP